MIQIVENNSKPANKLFYICAPLVGQYDQLHFSTLHTPYSGVWQVAYFEYIGSFKYSRCFQFSISWILFLAELFYLLVLGTNNFHLFICKVPLNERKSNS